VLIILKKEKVSKNHKIELLEYKDGKFIDIHNNLTYERIINSPNYNFSFSTELSFDVPTVKLGDIAKLSMGIKTSDNTKFILDNKKDEDCQPLLRGKDIGRYNLNYSNKYIWYKPELMMKKVGAGPRKPEYFKTPKLLFREITGGGIIATFDSENYFTNNKIHILYFIKDFDLKFILALVNSKLINFWIKSTFNNSFQVEINQLQEILIPQIDFSNKIEKQKHDELAKLADKILKLNKQLQKLNPILDEDEYKELKTEIQKTDKEIDEMVYKLYGLTEEEIKIVENNK
ncbi:MAG: TaqI-like C-terminal specificity domain-containing protein, partial [Candidatus Subteraquimicrobiales bacterium]|nr:TaqI-like C-terminal specificity domain-containing protein [Candidatus Subteraquimicrobiales bacterium]